MKRGRSRDALVDVLDEDGMGLTHLDEKTVGRRLEEDGLGVGDRGWTPHADVSVTLALRLGRTRMLQLNQRFYSAAAPSGDSGEDPFAKPQLGSGGRLQASPATLPLPSSHARRERRAAAAAVRAVASPPPGEAFNRRLNA